jgi:hypothetical protein
LREKEDEMRTITITEERKSEFEINLFRREIMGLCELCHAV